MEDRERQLQKLLGEIRRRGYRGQERMCLNTLGELARSRGDAEAARQWYRQARRLAREMGLRR